MKRSWAVFATLSLGCAGQSAPEPHDINLVERCGEVVSLAGNLFPTDRYGFVAEHCVAPMVREPACRDAVMRSLHVDASSRNTLVARACTRAYCPRLPAPKPELCTRDFEAMSPSEMRPLGLELFARVRRLELGAAEAARWEQVVGADAPTTVATAPSPPPKVAEPKAPPRVAEPKPAKKVAEPKPPKVVEPPHRIVAPEPPPKVVAPEPPPKVVAAPPKAIEPPPKLVAPVPPPKAVEPPPKVASPTPPPRAVEPPPKVVTPTPAPKAVEPPARVVAPAQPKAVAPSADVPAGAVVVRVTVHNRALRLEVGGASWNLSEKPTPGEFDPAAERAVELGARSERVVVQLGSGIQYNDLVGILNALGRQYVSNISLTSIKD